MTHAPILRPSLRALGLSLLLACTTSPAPGGGSGPGGGPGGSGPGTGPGGSPGGGTPPVASFCAGSGPIVDLGTVSTPPAPGACDGDSFAAAVCSCTDLEVNGYVAVASRDPAFPAAGSLGTNGNSLVHGFASVGGHVVVAGDRPLGFYGYLRSGGKLEAAGPVAVADSGFTAGYLEVAGDTRVDGDLALLGYATIGGDLTQPAGARTPVVLDVVGSRTVAAVDVAPPCACRADQIPDLAGMVADGAAHNDNAAIGLAPDRLRDVIGVGTVELPCGHYYLDEISGAGLIALKATGRVALFVGGDVNATGLFALEVAPGAEVDLIIGGSLRATGAQAFGALDRPGSLRVYVAGDGDVHLTGAGGFAGNLYAPRAKILGQGATFVEGSLFGRRIEIPGFLQVGYDPLVRGDCGPPID